MAAELKSRGARVVLAPLIDCELPEDPSQLDDHLLVAGHYDWIILTSVTTARALEQRARALGRILPELFGAAHVAAVGTATRDALKDLGVNVDLVPETNQSAEGLLEVLSVEHAGTGTRALLPQSGIAADTLRAGLQDRGWSVDAVTAYTPVSYPAASGRRIHGDAADETSLTVIGHQDLVTALANGEIGAVVLTSPSIAERLHAMMGELSMEAATVAIGRRTERDAVALGMRVDAVAASPNPTGIADAVAVAVVNQRKRR